MSKLSIPTMIIALLVVVILLTFACTYQVNYYEAVVKVRLGQARDVITDAGLKMRWPWPIESIYHYDTRLRTLDTPETEVKTVDGKNLIIGLYAIWRIDNALQFHQRVRTVAEAERQVRDRIRGVQESVVGQKDLSYFVNLDRALVDQNYEQFFKELREGVRQEVLDEYGVEIEEIGVRRISLPQDVTQKVFDSMIQERKTKAAKYREEGNSRAEAIKAQAEADAKQILAFADRKAQEIRSAGYEASTRILNQISETDREFFEWLRWLDALRASLKQKTTIFIDQTWPFHEVFVNPPVPAEAQP